MHLELSEGLHTILKVLQIAFVQNVSVKDYIYIQVTQTKSSSGNDPYHLNVS